MFRTRLLNMLLFCCDRLAKPALQQGDSSENRETGPILNISDFTNEWNKVALEAAQKKRKAMSKESP